MPGGLAVFPAKASGQGAWSLRAGDDTRTRHRAYFVGHLSVPHGALVQEDATDGRDLVAAPPPRTAAQLEACSRSGLPDQAAQFQQARQRPLSLLVVWTGRRPRLYMTWDECKAAVVGGRRKFQEGL